MKYKNPIIQGFNPDPSICRVNEDYYMVTSTFEFTPGVPIYHSRNLVDWKLISYCLQEENQIPLKGALASEGIYAPTIRYNKGTFYMTTTNVTNGGNFYVTTDNIRSKWSTPIWVNMSGIDPTIFFDNDKAYYMTNGYTDKHGIALAEIDIKTGDLLSIPKWISNGDGGRFCEAPHMYKIDDYYYLMVAEGGTEEGHCVTIHRSKEIYGPYERYSDNPILSHAIHPFSPIQATGHADLVWDNNENCWLVCLGIRTIDGKHLHNLGREVFLAKVEWHEGWPTVGDNGTIQLEMDAYLPDIPKQEEIPFIETFKNNLLDIRWTWVRNKNPLAYRIDNEMLKLIYQDVILSSRDDSPCFMGIRQEEFNMCFDVKICLEHAQNDFYGGVTAYYNDSYHYDLFMRSNAGKLSVGIRKKIHDIEVVVIETIIEKSKYMQFRIESNKENYKFYYLIDTHYIYLGQGMTAGLCSETTHTMTFTGTFFGLFCDEGEMQFDHVICENNSSGRK